MSLRAGRSECRRVASNRTDRALDNPRSPPPAAEADRRVASCLWLTGPRAQLDLISHEGHSGSSFSTMTSARSVGATVLK